MDSEDRKLCGRKDSLLSSAPAHRSLGHTAENTSRILKRDGSNAGLYDHRGAATNSGRMGCSCGHQTCMDFLGVRAPNFRLPHHIELVGNRMCQKCLHHTKKLDEKGEALLCRMQFPSFYIKLTPLEMGSSGRRLSVCETSILVKCSHKL